MPFDPSKGRVVICDNGTGLVKCGFAGDTLPRCVFPCMVGRPALRYQDQLASQQLKDVMVGDECAANQHQLDITYPMTNGIVQSWSDMQLVWDHTFNQQLCIDPTESRLLLTDPALNPKANREKTMQIMFEQYGVAGLNIQVQGVLTLYAQGLLTGLVVDSGDGVSHAVAVVQGYAFPNQTKRLNVAGRHVTQHLLDLLLRRGYALNKATDFDAVRRIKEDLCYVAFDTQRELKLARETTCLMKSYTLPDGRVIRVGAERFMAPEAMFNPSLVDVEAPGIAEMAFNAINDCDIDNRRQLYEHIVISGGSTMYPGLPTRMEKEVKQLYLQKVAQGDIAQMSKLRIRIEDPPTRKHAVFLGGAVLADIMKDQDDFWISKAEYDEDPHRALKKCGIA